MNLRIDGRATIKDASLTGGSTIENEIVDINEGDVIVSDGPISIEIVSDSDSDADADDE